jgi:hypothetical protein
MLIISFIDLYVMSSPKSKMLPVAPCTSPVITSASSFWPFPSTPTIPRTSPAHTLMDFSSFYFKVYIVICSRGTKVLRD